MDVEIPAMGESVERSGILQVLSIESIDEFGVFAVRVELRHIHSFFAMFTHTKTTFLI